jgi:hypothetical protein
MYFIYLFMLYYGRCHCLISHGVDPASAKCLGHTVLVWKCEREVSLEGKCILFIYLCCIMDAVSISYGIT